MMKGRRKKRERRELSQSDPSRNTLATTFATTVGSSSKTCINFGHWNIDSYRLGCLLQSLFRAGTLLDFWCFKSVQG